MPTVLSPFVYWAQSEANVSLKVDLKDSKNPNVRFDRRKLTFESKGVGAQGFQNYGFILEFYSEIDTKESSCKIQDSKIDINLVKKKKNSWWPRLTSVQQKPVWLKIDFDRWQTEDDMNSEDENKLRDIREDYSDLYNKLQKEEFGYTKEDLTKVYLVIYNLLMFVGFTYIFSVLGIRYLRDGKDSFTEAQEAVGTVIKYLHVLQFSEVILPMLGLTKGGVFAPLIQVGGRLIVLFILINSEPRLQVQPLIYYLYLTYSLVELIRYPYYITQVIGVEVYFLTWLRYTVWIILYPIGLSCEATVVYNSILYLDETKKFSIDMPNWFNFTFCLGTVLRIYLLLFFLPTAYFLILHMYRARRKRIGSHN